MNPYIIPGLMSTEEIAAAIWGISDVQVLQMRIRNWNVVECRDVLFHHLMKTTSLSPASIGRCYNMDRNTVKHAYTTVENLLENNLEFKRKHDLFMKRIRK